MGSPLDVIALTGEITPKGDAIYRFLGHAGVDVNS